MISVNNLSVHFGADILFDNISLNINKRDRIGLAGRNGAGKTTLLRIIAGQQKPTEGTVAVPEDVTIGYLPQEMVVKGDKSIYEETLSAFEEEQNLKRTIEKLTAEISVGKDHDSPEYLDLIHRLDEANNRFQLIGGNNIEENIEKVLLGLGFSRKDFERNIKEFSGGWQIRVEIAKLLLKKHDVLLLDEPTNHLDIESIQWLEEYLDNYDGAVVLVSHDRTLLDNITKRTVEISLGKVFDYKAPYSKYVVLRKERMESQIATYNNQQKQIEDIEKFIERFRYKATKAVQVQSRIKMLKKIERIEIDEEDKSGIYIKFPPAPRSGKVVVSAEELSKRYDANEVLQNIEFHIDAKEKIAFVGKNGEGKTTLSRIIVGELEHEGKCTVGYNVSIGYYAQNQSDLLDMDKTVLETIDDVAVGDIRTKIREILGSFLFSDDDVYKKVKILSGGEKSRLALAKLLLTPVNLLVLDEPTNHLDMRSKEILKQALQKYDGTLIVVSHDRYFLQGLTDKVFEFKNKSVRQYIGSIYDFLKSRKIETLRQLEISAKKNGDKTENISENKLKYEEKKQKERDLRKLNSQILKCEKRIEELESEIKTMEVKLIEPVILQNHEKQKEIFIRIDEMKKELTLEVNRWDELHKKSNYEF
ncbi:MAG: ABC-F family ATP-binding cassette domain-containing protein [Bacteroidales bacterium]|nr:ABC-F family ATP-binding cassette domain-containing protein [Bacteroidales bacterium]